MGTDPKKTILENVGRLKERIHFLEKELAASRAKLQDEKAKHFKNLCWWDAKPCACYTELAGLREAGKQCSRCYRVEGEVLCSILAEIEFSGYTESVQEWKQEVDATRKAGEELLDETLQEIHEEVLDFLAEAGVEPG